MKIIWQGGWREGDGYYLHLILYKETKAHKNGHWKIWVHLISFTQCMCLQPFVSSPDRSQLSITLTPINSRWRPNICFSWTKVKTGKFFSHAIFQHLDCSKKNPQQNNNKNSLIKKEFVQNMVQNVGLFHLNCPPVNFHVAVWPETSLSVIAFYLNFLLLIKDDILKTRSQNCTHKYFWDTEPSAIAL